MVLLGGLMLVDRASDGVISAAFQRDSSDARDAAETGMTCIVGELNRPQNRGLLAKQTSGDDPASYRWRSGDPANSINSCLGPDTGTPDLSANPNLGFVAEGDGNPAPAYSRVLLDKDGRWLPTSIRPPRPTGCCG